MIDYSNLICTCYSRNLLDKYIPQICSDEYMFFLNKPNVVGVGFSFKCINNIYTKEKCITVFVETKVPEILLNSETIIPKLYKGIKTDVIETGIFTPLALNTRIRPVTGGYSISNVNSLIGCGTMACLVTDDTNSVYILGNNHVLSVYNTEPIGSAILQTCLSYGGKAPDDTIATLFRYVPIKFMSEKSTPANFVDCAIAKAVDPNLLSADITFIGKPKGVIIPRIGYGVKKVGAFSELTSGLILATGITQRFDSSFGSYIMKDCIMTSVMATGGDSGSLLLDAQDYAIGLLMGSGGKKSYTSFCSIIKALSILKVKLITS